MLEWFKTLPFDEKTGKIKLPKAFSGEETPAPDELEPATQLAILRAMLANNKESTREDFWDGVDDGTN